MSARDETPTQPLEQLHYATLLDCGTKLGFVVLVVAFAAYVTGLLPAFIPHERLPEVWGLPLDAYLAKTGAPTGWAWVGLVAKGDYASIAGIALLSACSLPCLLVIVPDYWRRGERGLATIAALIALVLLFAASGLLVAGH